MHRFVSRLLGEMEVPHSAHPVQHISLPRHHLDKPDAKPKCKGFGLVTLASLEDVDLLVQRWPWQRQRGKADDSASVILQDAIRFGFRTIKKTQWETLNAEYLAYRQRLLDELNQAQDIEVEAEPSQPRQAAPPQEAPIVPSSRSSVFTLDLSASYPPGCLAYIRNVHTETNKTTLRKLFSRAFVDSDTSATSDGIDYVDFNKGMDTVR